MFQSLEYKHPKFYQVFRLFIVFFASLLYAWNLRCFAKTACFREDFPDCRFYYSRSG